MMRYANYDYAVKTEFDLGRILIFADNPCKLAEIQAMVYDRISGFGCVDFYGILSCLNIPACRSDLFWWIRDVSIDDLIINWKIEQNNDSSIPYKYVATITKFECIKV